MRLKQLLSIAFLLFVVTKGSLANFSPSQKPSSVIQSETREKEIRKHLRSDNGILGTLSRFHEISIRSFQKRVDQTKFQWGRPSLLVGSEFVFKELFGVSISFARNWIDLGRIYLLYRSLLI